MTTLSDVLLAPAARANLANDLEALILHRTAQISGPAGVLIRAGLRTVRSIRPDIVRRGCQHLLPDFVQAMEAQYLAYLSQTDADFSHFLQARNTQVAEQLLAVTDRRLAQSHNRLLRASYRRLRPRAMAQICAALPDLAVLLQPYLA